MLVLALMTMMVAAVIVLFPDTKLGPVADPLAGSKRPRDGSTAFRSARLSSTACWRCSASCSCCCSRRRAMRLFGFLLPDTLVWFAMFDVGVFVDALLIAGAILATNGLRAVAGAGDRPAYAGIDGRAPAGGPGARSVRPPASRRAAQVVDDDRPAWAASARGIAPSAWRRRRAGLGLAAFGTAGAAPAVPGEDVHWAQAPVVGANFCRNRAAVTEPAWAQAAESFLRSAMSLSSAARSRPTAACATAGRARPRAAASRSAARASSSV